MSLFEDNQYQWRETYFVLFEQRDRPAAEKVVKELAKLEQHFDIKNVTANEQGQLEALTLISHDDNAAMDVTYLSGDEVREQVRELAEEMRGMPLDKEEQAKLDALAPCDARFDVFQLGEAALAGDVTRALRILAGLRSEGVEPTLALWSLAREIHNTWGTTQNDGYNARSWQRPSPMLETAKRRAGRLPYARLAARLSRADRMIKGQLRPGDAWDEMALLIVEFAGRRTLPLTGNRAA